MTNQITTYNSFEQVLPLVVPLLSKLHDPQLADVLAAYTPARNPVETLVEITEALYAAVLNDTALSDDDRKAVAAVCKQYGYLITLNRFYGKTQRCADMSVAMEALWAGTTYTALGGPEVDDKYKPMSILTVAPPTPTPT